MINKAYELACCNLFDEDIYKKLQISEKTFYNYLRDFTDFTDAIERGKAVCRKGKYKNRVNSAVDKCLDIQTLKSKETRIDSEGKKIMIIRENEIPQRDSVVIHLHKYINKEDPNIPGVGEEDCLSSALSEIAEILKNKNGR
jgi:hypothetical protein